MEAAQNKVTATGVVGFGAVHKAVVENQSLLAELC